MIQRNLVLATMGVATLILGGFFMCDVTQILSQIESGDPDAADKLLPFVYDELREELLAVHEALDELEKADFESAQLVKLRYFVGLSVDEAAECLGISPRKADFVWAYARKWLRIHLSTD